MSMLKVGLALAAGALLTLPVQGAVLDFTSGTVTGGFGGGFYSQDGFLVEWGFPDSAFPGADGTLEVRPGLNPAFFTIRAINGGRFSFQSMDFGILPGALTADLVVTPSTPVTGYADFGYVSIPPTVTREPLATLSLMTKQMTTYNASLSNVLEVQLLFSAPHRFGIGNTFNIDNITLQQGVPEPSSWALFILGFGAVGHTMRRRSNWVRVTKASLTIA